MSAREGAKKSGGTTPGRHRAPDSFNYQIYDEIGSMLGQGVPPPVMEARLSEKYGVERSTVRSWKHRVLRDWKAHREEMLTLRFEEARNRLLDHLNRARRAGAWNAVAAFERELREVDGTTMPKHHVLTGELTHVPVLSDPERVRARIQELAAKHPQLLAAKANGSGNGHANGNGAEVLGAGTGEEEDDEDEEA